jgi:hypothetical protein
LLDLIHLHPGAASLAYLRELCLQNLDRLNLDELQRLADLASPKLGRVAQFITELARAEAQEYETL